MASERFIEGSRRQITLPNTGTQAQRLITRQAERSSLFLNAAGAFDLVLGTANTVDADGATSTTVIRCEVNDLPIIVPWATEVAATGLSTNNAYASVYADADFTIEVREVRER